LLVKTLCIRVSAKVDDIILYCIAIVFLYCILKTKISGEFDNQRKILEEIRRDMENSVKRQKIRHNENQTTATSQAMNKAIRTYDSKECQTDEKANEYSKECQTGRNENADSKCQTNKNYKFESKQCQTDEKAKTDSKQCQTGGNENFDSKQCQTDEKVKKDSKQCQTRSNENADSKQSFVSKHRQTDKNESNDMKQCKTAENVESKQCKIEEIEYTEIKDCQTNSVKRRKITHNENQTTATIESKEYQTDKEESFVSEQRQTDKNESDETKQCKTDENVESKQYKTEEIEFTELRNCQTNEDLRTEYSICTSPNPGNQSEMSQNLERCIPDKNQEKGQKLFLNIIQPPKSMKFLHETIMSDLFSKGLEVIQDPNAPCLVTVANTSRVRADISRDLKKAKDTSSKEYIVLVLTPLRDIPESVTSLRKILSSWPENVSCMVHFIVDVNLEHIHQCDHNTKEHLSLISYLSDL